jgi:tRNA (cmo5U34)-methyltransferase
MRKNDLQNFLKESRIRKNLGSTEDFREAVEQMADAAYALRPNAKKILDVGCGFGHLAMNLMDRFQKTNFTLLDYQERMIQNAKIRTAGLTSGNIFFMQEDMRTVEIPTRSFDIITSINALHFLSFNEFIKILPKFKRWLARKGVLLIGGFVGHGNPKIGTVQSQRWLEHIEVTHHAKRAADLDRMFPNVFNQNTSVTLQMDVLKDTGFVEVELLYKRYCTGAYYAIKA